MPQHPLRALRALCPSALKRYLVNSLVCARRIARLLADSRVDDLGAIAFVLLTRGAALQFGGALVAGASVHFVIAALGTQFKFFLLTPWAWNMHLPRCCNTGT